LTFDAGATIPTLSPGRSARGLIRELRKAEIIGVDLVEEPVVKLAFLKAR
jgi:hypothetical protein